MIVQFILRVVEYSRRHALIVALLAFAASLSAGYYAGTHLSIDTDVDKLLDPNLPWRQREIAFDKEFPQYVNLIAVVVDGATPDIAADATAALAAKLGTQPEYFSAIDRPDGSKFFQQNGILLLPKDEVQAYADQIVAAQPLIGTLAADPRSFWANSVVHSARGHGRHLGCRNG